MIHFACISLPYQGHLDPMATLASELRRRGHRTTFFHMADVERVLGRFGLDLVTLGRSTHPPGWLDTASRNLGRVNGPFGVRRIVRDLAGVTSMLCDSLPAALRAHGIDVVIADQMEAAGGMCAYRLGLPFVSLAAMLPLNWEIGVPSPFVGWSYGESRWHRARNVASAFGAKAAMRPIGDVIESFATNWGIMRGRQIEHYMSGFAQLSQLTRSIDLPRRSIIGCFHYCGPLRQTASRRRTMRTHRAFASLGTLQGHRYDLFERILRACEANGLDLTIAHGGRLTPQQAARLGRRAEIRDFVAHGDILPDCDVAIVHGGMNTVLDALAAGVPLVVMPLAFEQAATAARVDTSGTGRVCRPSLTTAGRLSTTIADVTQEPSYSRAAAAISEEIGSVGGLGRAADIVEYVARTGQPYLNEAAIARERLCSAGPVLAPAS